MRRPRSGRSSTTCARRAESRRAGRRRRQGEESPPKAPGTVATVGGAEYTGFEMAGVHLLSACLTERSRTGGERDLNMGTPPDVPGGVSVECAVRAGAEGDR